MSFGEFQANFEGRLMALARSHDLLIERGWARNDRSADFSLLLSQCPLRLRQQIRKEMLKPLNSGE